MLNRKYFQYNNKVWLFVLLTVGLLTACGQEQDKSAVDADGTYDVHEEINASGQSFEDAAEVLTAEEVTTTDKINEAVMTDEVGKVVETAESKELKKLFGANCITEQTFEVELSEYEEKVWFVPFAPARAEDFHIQLMQDGEELYELSAYVPEKLAGEEFVSLDAAAFFDVNYDNNTDIVMIETYADTSFAVIYYGEVWDAYYDGKVDVFFYAKERLSDNLTNSVEELTIPVIRDFLGNGKKNGEFADYREAYLAVAKLREMESNGKYKYKLIYFDDDEVPELIADDPGYHVSLYTYRDGRIYPIMYEWGYGAMGNAGYEYCPRKSSVRNYNADYAGLILYTSYWTLGDGYMLDGVVSIETLNFDDVNGNGMPDGDEEESYGYYNVSYIDGKEVTAEECESYSMGEYEWLGAGSDGMSLEELEEALN